MRFFYLNIVLVLLSSAVYSQSTIRQIDTTVLAIDSSSNLTCFKYSDTVQGKNRYTTREFTFHFDKAKKTDTLKVLMMYADSGSYYRSLVGHYYFVKGRPIKKIISRIRLDNEVETRSIYFIGRSEIAQGDELPDFSWWTHRQDSEHIFKTYKRFLRKGYYKKLPACR